MNVDPETIATLLGALGLSGITAGLINAISNRKKTGADATKVITDAALGVVTQLQERIKELLAEQTTLKQEVSDLQDREDDRDSRETAARKALLKHHEWDLRLTRLINEKLPDHSGELLPPPPLLDELEFEHREKRN